MLTAHLTVGEACTCSPVMRMLFGPQKKGFSRDKLHVICDA